MVEYAEAECATCHAIRPKNEMRQVRVKRLASVSRGSGQSSRTGRSNSYSPFNSSRLRSTSSISSASRTSTRRNYKIHDLWVCKGCRAPKSDKDGLGFWGWAAGAVVVILAVGSQRGDETERTEAVPEVEAAALGPVAEPSPPAPFEAEREQSLEETSLQGSQTDIVFESSPVVQPIEEAITPADEESTEAKTDAPPEYDCSAVTEEGRANLEYLRAIGCEAVYNGKGQ